MTPEEFDGFLDDLASLADAYAIASRTFAREHPSPLAAMCFSRMMGLIEEHMAGQRVEVHKTAIEAHKTATEAHKTATEAHKTAIEAHPEPEKSRTECRHRTLSARQAPQR
jgi:hypothetical protein